LPSWSRASHDPRKIRRQIIDVHSKSVPFVEQQRYERGENLVYMH
jgi:hypothetical protein